MSRYLNLIFLCICIPAFAKDPEVYRYNLALYGGGSIHLYKNGDYRLYNSAGGCINPVGITNMGKWSMKKDTVVFYPISKKSLVGIDTVIETGPPSDSITLTVLDKNGENVTSKMSLAWHVNRIGYYPAFTYPSKTDRNAVVIVRSRPGATLSLRSVNTFLATGKDIDVTKAQKFVVKLGIDGDLISAHYRTIYSDEGPGPLRKKADTLSELLEHPLMAKYVREK